MTIVNNPTNIILDRFKENRSLFSTYLTSKKHKRKLELNNESVGFNLFSNIVKQISSICIIPSETLQKYYYTDVKNNKNYEFYVQLVDKENKGHRLRIYHLGKLLGSGGFGNVYQCTKVHTGDDKSLVAKEAKRIIKKPQDKPVEPEEKAAEPKEKVAESKDKAAESKEKAPKPKKEKVDLIGFSSSGPALIRERNHLLLVQELFQSNDKAKSRLHDEHIPIISVRSQFYQSLIGENLILLDKGDFTLERVKGMGFLDFNSENILILARDIFNALMILEDIEVANGDIKKNNVIIQMHSSEDGNRYRCKIIDFSALVQLPSSNQEIYTGTKSLEQTRVYYPKQLVELLENAKTNEAVRKAFILRQRAAFGYVLYNLLTLDNVLHAAKKESTDIDFMSSDFKLNNLDRLPTQMGNLIKSLFSFEVVDLEPFVSIFIDPVLQEAYRDIFGRFNFESDGNLVFGQIDKKI